MVKKDAAEVIAKFTDENVSFIVKQPEAPPTEEQLEKLYTALGTILYS